MVTIKVSPKTFTQTWLPAITWGVAGGLVAFLAVVMVFRDYTQARYNRTHNVSQAAAVISTQKPAEADLPALEPAAGVFGLERAINPLTIIASRQRQSVVTYTVEKKDSIFGIASKFNLKPETILWANKDLLGDNPDSLSPGQVLNIPPVDGVYYKWGEKDSIDTVASEFKVKPDDILLYSPNKLDITNPVVKPDTYVMVPGGKREVQQWVMPVVPLGKGHGVSTNVMGPGGCVVNGGAYGTGTFMYPTRDPRLSGNDYWSGHLGIDLACGMGDQIRSADGGVVVYSGGAAGGYGNVVVVDHGNGYQTLYAHLTNTATSCGASVQQGSLLGYCGSTGNSTGPHLHFEVRYLGGFVNPWYVLP